MPINSFWTEKINFKNLCVPRFMSAPIDGIIDSSLRQLIREYSKDELLWGQMRHVASIANANRVDEFNINKKEQPICFQISANSTDFIEEAIEKILDQKTSKKTFSEETFNVNVFDMINLNSGCPAKKIINSGTGSALMANIPMLKKIIIKIKKTMDSAHTNIPFTIKIRAGFIEKNALEVAIMAEDLGVDGIVIHPRLKSQGFTGELDFKIVKTIKEQVKVPVIFSGNIIDAQSAKQTYERTGVDGFMIGRALYGAPWKIKEIIQHLEGKEFEVTEKDKIEVAKRHLLLNTQHYGHDIGFNMIKKHLPMYVKNIDGAAIIRQKLVRANSEKEMNEILNNLAENLAK